jgi:phosphatidylglycerophosphatase A
MIKRNSVPASVWRNPVHFIAFGFGSGAAPVAPGTFGTLAAIPVYLLIAPDRRLFDYHGSCASGMAVGCDWFFSI